MCEQKRDMITRALNAMRALEAGAIANRDEKRMVGHYWLRNPALAPTTEIRTAIEEAISTVKGFAADIHNAFAPAYRGQNGVRQRPCRDCCGIG